MINYKVLIRVVVVVVVVVVVFFVQSLFNH